MLWANLHLLFWLSLVPFVTGWMGENHFAPLPTAVYGVVLLMAAIACSILQNAIVAQQGPGLAAGRRHSASDIKGKMSLVLYLAAIPLAFVDHVDRRCPLRRGGAHVAGSRSPDRARPRPLDHQDGRRRPTPVACSKRVRQLQHAEIVAVPSDDLEADRQPLRREAGRHRDRGTERARVIQ